MVDRLGREGLKAPAAEVGHQAHASATRKAATKVTGQDLPAAVPALAYLAMGIAGEAGRSPKVKKLFRDQPALVESLARQDSAESVRELRFLTT